MIWINISAARRIMEAMAIPSTAPRRRRTLPVLGLIFCLICTALTAPASAADNKRFNEALLSYQYGDYSEAFRKFLSLADEGDSDAQYYVGFMYAQGLGVAQNYEEAADWYERAALQGHAPAQNYLGLLYYEGKGVDKDFRSAFIYFELAAAQGNQDGVNNRLIVARKMTTDQITEAQKAAGRLIRKIDTSEGIRLPNSLGSGVVVSAAGHVLTHRSVIDGCKLIKVRHGKTVEDADVALKDEFNDLVLLSTDPGIGDPAIMGAGEPEDGAELVMFAHHIDDDLAISPNIAETTVINTPNLVRTDRRYFEVSPPDGMNSENGAPLYDAKGALVGIVVTGIRPESIGRVKGALPEKMTFAMRADLMSVLMHINGIGFVKAKADPDGATDVETAESASAVAVECWLGEGRTINPGAISRMRQAGQ